MEVSHSFFFFFNDTATTEIYTLSLHDALPIFLIGLALTNMIRPGVGVEIPGNTEAFDPSELQQPDSLGNIIIRMIPTNPIKAAAEGDILALIFFSIAFGFAITQLKGKPHEFLLNFFDYSFHAMMKLTHGIIKLAPIGVFGLIANAVATAGFGLFKAVGMYMITIAAGLTLHFFFVQIGRASCRERV